MADKTLTGAFNAPDTSVSQSPEKQSGGAFSLVDKTVASVAFLAMVGSPYAAKAAELTTAYAAERAECSAWVVSGLAKLDAVIAEEAKSGSNPVKLEKMIAKRQEFYERDMNSCVTTIVAKRKGNEADAKIAQADTQLAQADTQLAQGNTQLAQADVAGKRGKNIEAAIAIFTQHINGAKNSEDLRKLNEMIAQSPTFSKEAREYMIVAKPVYMRTEWGAERYAQLDMAVRRIEVIASQQWQQNTSYKDSNYGNVSYNAPQK